MKCLNDATLQSLLDGELSAELTKAAAHHIARCTRCAEAVRQVEDESMLLTDTFDSEMSVSVPTAHLRQRVEAAALACETPHTDAAAGCHRSGFYKALHASLTPLGWRPFGFVPATSVAAVLTVVAVVVCATLLSATMMRARGVKNGVKESHRGSEVNSELAKLNHKPSSEQPAANKASNVHGKTDEQSNAGNLAGEKHTGTQIALQANANSKVKGGHPRFGDNPFVKHFKHRSRKVAGNTNRDAPQRRMIHQQSVAARYAHNSTGLKATPKRQAKSEGEIAKARLMLALQIASTELNSLRKKIQG